MLSIDLIELRIFGAVGHGENARVTTTEATVATVSAAAIAGAATAAATEQTTACGESSSHSPVVPSTMIAGNCAEGALIYCVCVCVWQWQYEWVSYCLIHLRYIDSMDTQHKSTAYTATPDIIV